ncbi:exo-alpha-sialidase [Paucibacter sp. APW11]|uniref:Exo-alpha-sialidase n=1 Tax=Roseateles aquae TaxID=3077235 RepID=A0ABU3PD38_9BURK|nr:exo-alpha-sialidase [Paucibacter sp. APW11]MDT9000510.1 exo-alpha-sialidase [Paucibacter sp. APW11]
MSLTAWVATRKGLFELQHLGTGGWQIRRNSFLGDPVSMVLPPAPSGHAAGRLLAALNLGHFGAKLHASDDGGASWQELPAPAFPPQPEPHDGGPAWKLLQIWSLARSESALWAGTVPGGLFRSSNAGASWQLVDALWQRPERLEWMGGGNEAPGIHSLLPHPSNGQDLTLAISCGGVWHSADEGASWALHGRGLNAGYMPPERQQDMNVQDPHCLQRCRAVPEVIWCQHHCGIWRSVDGGLSWQELKAPLSSFGFAVAAHPSDPQTAWFVPAIKDERRIPVDGALVVNRTRDGGQSWETLRAGLPQQHCYDLVYRHGLAVDASGQHLLMGSTTGGLWASDDGGEHWQTVAAHLPPIYALAIA